jgi:hypothetical protein
MGVDGGNLRFEINYKDIIGGGYGLLWGSIGVYLSRE